MQDPIRILIAASHPAVRAELRTLFGLAEGFTLTGETASQEETIRQAEAIHPDVVLIDLEMNGGDGEVYALITRLKELNLARAVAVLTAHDLPAVIAGVAASGGDAVIIKGADFNAMLDILRKIL